MSKAKRKLEGNKRLPAWVILIGFILFLSYLYIGGEYGLLEHYKQHKKKQAVVETLESLKMEQDSLRIMIERLRADSSFIGKIAREKYNMGYSDEEIIRVIYKETQ
ncbi:MAG: septum formation initiator family protein [bacterium]